MGWQYRSGIHKMEWKGQAFFILYWMWISMFRRDVVVQHKLVCAGVYSGCIYPSQTFVMNKYIGTIRPQSIAVPSFLFVYTAQERRVNRWRFVENTTKIMALLKGKETRQQAIVLLDRCWRMFRTRFRSSGSHFGWCRPREQLFYLDGRGESRWYQEVHSFENEMYSGHWWICGCDCILTMSMLPVILTFRIQRSVFKQRDGRSHHCCYWDAQRSGWAWRSRWDRAIFFNNGIQGDVNPFRTFCARRSHLSSWRAISQRVLHFVWRDRRTGELRRNV